jgi:hypothetical protein
MNQEHLDAHWNAEETEAAAQRARRDFLKKSGKLAAYTPPVMLALMYPGAHAIASGGVSGCDHGHASDHNPHC